MVRKYGSPPLTTLKPSEQREPEPQIASPPAMSGVNSPAVLLSSAVPPRPSTTVESFFQAAPSTVLSAVTRTLLLTGSTAQEVPGIVAFSVRACRADFSSAREFSTILALPPAWRTCSAPASSTTFTTRAFAVVS